jgi:hypothetical protein
MNRIVGSVAVLAGFFLLLPGVVALLARSSSAPLAAWIVRDLIVAALCGAALFYWGVSTIRHRQLDMGDLQPARIRRR